MSIKNNKHKKLTSELQLLKKDKRQFDDKYNDILSPEKFSEVVGLVIIEENVKMLKKVSRKYDIPQNELLKMALPAKTDVELAVLSEVDENEDFEPLQSNEIKKPVFNKVVVGKKTFFENERDNDPNLYDENMNIVGEIKMKKEYTVFKPSKSKTSTTKD
jgi:hypothetical protein